MSIVTENPKSYLGRREYSFQFDRIIIIMIIIGVSRFQFGSNWQSLTVITVDLSSRVTFLQAVRQELTFTFFA